MKLHRTNPAAPTMVSNLDMCFRSCKMVIITSLDDEEQVDELFAGFEPETTTASESTEATASESTEATVSA